MADRVQFTVCVLCYGDYEQLARRCLDSLRPLWRAGRIRLRLGANMVGSGTAAYLNQVTQECPLDHGVNSEINLYKYPVMWRLLHEVPISTPYVMWFDDDSFINAADPLAWLTGIERQMQKADMLGSIWYQHLQGGQHLWIKSRKWYWGGVDSKRAVPPNHQVSFATGGWWTIKTDILRQWMWPDTEIIHRGGDVMLGELCRQRGYRLVNLPKPKGVAINADEHGNECKSKKRGFNEQPVGTHYRG